MRRLERKEPGGAARTGGDAAAPPLSWWGMDTEAVAATLGTDSKTGLTAPEAEDRLRTHGPNRLPEEPHESAFLRLLKQFNNVLIYVLLGAAILTAVLGEWIDTGVIVAVVLVNGIIGFIQEGKAERALEGIRRMLSLEAAVVRGGRRNRISAEQLVPGDVVLLESGDRVPADLRLVHTRNCRVDEAVLTGESVPVVKDVEPVPEESLIGDRRSMAFSGTMVTAGQARGIVVATGGATEIGRIGEMVSAVGKITTPLLQAIDRFGRQLSVAIVGLSVVLFAYGWFQRDYAPGDLFLFVVSFTVATIPEGLPAIMTITLALGVQRMAKRNAIIRHLPAVETLGSVTVICSDKTGTLTRNEMTAARVITSVSEVEVTGAGYGTEGEFLLDGRGVPATGVPGLVELARAGLLCNDAELGGTSEDGEHRLQGDPTEGAMLVLGVKAGMDPVEEHREWPRIDQIPFESEIRFMATLHRAPSGEGWIYVKGAPERVLEMCDSVRSADGEAALDREEWHRRIDAVAGEGHRMLAVAAKRADAGQDRLPPPDEVKGLTLLGVAGLIDPPRPEAIEAVETCHRAGIRVKMITGDHARTARSIGARLGLGDGDGVLTGAEVEKASDEELVELVETHDVFARSSPEHKLRLVRALRSRGEVCAMTGDGVNDSPALKQADIGVAMGIKGSEAAKGASEMVLADDNFASIAAAVEEGRTVYDNLKKTILFILPTNGAEGLMVLSTVVLALRELPITPVQILWVNMITAVTLALALAFEPAEPGIMSRPPRPPGEPMLSGYLIWRIAIVAILVALAAQYLFMRELNSGRAPEVARTLAVNTLVAGQVFYLFNSRYLYSRSFLPRRLIANRAAIVAGALLLVFQAVFTYVPIFQTWFGTAPLRLDDWLWATGAGLAIFAIIEVEKTFLRRRKGWSHFDEEDARVPGG